MGATKMKKAVIYLLFLATLLIGCSRETEHSELIIGGFINHLRDQGVDGTLEINIPSNEKMEYVANYVIAKYTSTRIISFFKFSSAESAESSLAEAIKNPKMSGQARNGTIIMAATFYPPDEEAVNRIKELFLDYKF